MNNFKVFDIETTDWNKIYAIGIYNGLKCNILAKQNKKNEYFIKYLLDNLDDNDIIYAHNGGKFDFLFIIDYADKNDDLIIVDIKLINSSIGYLKISYHKKTIIFKDSYLILPKSLLKLTTDFDVKHKKLEMDYELGIEDKRFNKYFENDLKGLYELLEQVDTAHLTLASTSISVFLKQFYRTKPAKNFLNVDNIFREAYKGGRTEIFNFKGKDLYYYDINSLYPYVMQKYKFPIIQSNNFNFSNQLTSNGLYYCYITTPPKIHIPILSYKKDNKLIFPVGCFNGWFYGAELLKAKELGYIIKIQRGYEFKTAYLFKDFVNHFYQIKKSATGSKREIAKLYLNSLYGKFGQKHYQKSYQLLKNDDEKDIVLSKKYKLKSNPLILQYPFIHSEIAGMITSYARLELYLLIERAGPENVYYCDTDSIITSTKLKTGNEIGEIKLEHKIKNFIALSPKFYSIKDENDQEFNFMKGFNNKMDFDFQDFENALTKKDLNKFKNNYEKICSIKENQKRHLQEFISKITISKNIHLLKDKRNINKDYSTTPIKI